MIFWHLFDYQHGTWVELYPFIMLKPLLMGCILHLGVNALKGAKDYVLTS
jgi:hypothetical protein